MSNRMARRRPFTLVPLLCALMLGLTLPATAAPGAQRAPGEAQDFDLQAHRGGLGLTVESSLAGFAKALELGVTTLELDVQITADGVAMVTHDRQISANNKCADTAPVTPDDPDFPYVGKHVHTLTFDQVRTLDCGSQTLPEHPGQQAVPGARMPTLAEVFDLVREHGADGVMLNVETKVEAGAPEETAPREQFVQVVAQEVRDAGLLDQVTIQSFDWGALMRMAEVEPALPLVALTNRDFLEVGQPGASPWLGGIDIDDFEGSLVAAAASFGASAISPVHGFPQDGKITDPGYEPYVTEEMVQEAHAAGLRVIPWTVDDTETMASLMDKGVDGIITDYPDRLRDLMTSRGLPLPQAYPSPRVETPLAPAHAHNDYEHDQPLQDAIDHGFTSVEADVWLVDGELLVAHDLADVDPDRTLESLYLEPLAELTEENGGSVHPGWDGQFQLLIDLKSEGESTYAAVHEELWEHKRMMTTSTGRITRPGAVTAVISGNRPLETMQDQRVRVAGYDGRLGDLDGDLRSSFMPMVSDNWTNHFDWTGEGPMPTSEREKLQQLVESAHRDGYRLRFWATPDAPGPERTAIWTALTETGVDHINTDDLAALEAFLRNREREQEADAG